MRFEPSFLDVTPRRAILRRILANLKHVYVARSDHEMALTLRRPHSPARTRRPHRTARSRPPLPRARMLPCRARRPPLLPRARRRRSGRAQGPPARRRPRDAGGNAPLTGVCRGSTATIQSWRSRARGPGQEASMTSWWIVTAAVSGAIAVVAGAFGAHGLRARVTPDQLSAWTTATQYHLLHSVAPARTRTLGDTWRAVDSRVGSALPGWHDPLLRLDLRAGPHRAAMARPHHTPGRPLLDRRLDLADPAGAPVARHPHTRVSKCLVTKQGDDDDAGDRRSGATTRRAVYALRARSTTDEREGKRLLPMRARDPRRVVSRLPAASCHHVSGLRGDHEPRRFVIRGARDQAHSRERSTARCQPA